MFAMISQRSGPYSKVRIANLKGIWTKIFPHLVSSIV